MKFYSRCFLLVIVVIVLYLNLRAVSVYLNRESEESDLIVKDTRDELHTTLVTDSSELHANFALNEVLQMKSFIDKGITIPRKTIGENSRRHIADMVNEQIVVEKETTKIKDVTLVNSNPLILNENICKNDNPNLIIMVPSVPSHANNRKAIRETYAQLSRDKINKINGEDIPYIVRTIFLLGRGANGVLDRRILLENDKYNDIVQFDFKDSYYNLTLKLLHGFQWINHYCNMAKYVLKSDEDVFVNVALLIKQLERHTLLANGVVFGYLYNSAKVWRFGKWAIDKSVYDKEILPRYASGTAYVLSVNILSQIVKAATETAYVKVEDAYITGIIAAEKLGASLVMLNGSSHLNEDSMEPCHFVENKRLTKTNLKGKQLYSFWNALISFEKECYRKRPGSKGL